MSVIVIVFAFVFELELFLLPVWDIIHSLHPTRSFIQAPGNQGLGTLRSKFLFPSHCLSSQNLSVLSEENIQSLELSKKELKK